MQIRQTDSSQEAKAGGFLQFVQKRFLLVLFAIAIGAVLAFFTFQIWSPFFIGNIHVVPGKVFSLPSESTIVKDFQIISTNPLAYYVILSDFDSNEEYVIWSGRKEKRYQKIESLTISLDGLHIAYIGNDGDQHILVYDSKEIAQYEFIDDIVFSLNGKRIAYIVGEECRGVNEEDEDSCEKYRVVLDGEKQTVYENVRGFRFSLDGAKTIYAAREGFQEFIILNGEFDSAYLSVRDLQFTSDGSDFVFVVQDYNRRYIANFRSRVEKQKKVDFGTQEIAEEFVDEEDDKNNESFESDSEVSKKEEHVNSYENILQMIVSPDEVHLVYVVQEQGETFLVVDEIEQKHYAEASIAEIVFSPDSQHLAYTVQNEEQTFLVFNGLEEGTYARVFEIVFSPDSQHFAYRILTDTSEQAVILNGQLEEKYDSVRSLIFSSDNKHLIYVATRCISRDSGIRNCKEFSVVGDQELEKFDKVSHPVFSEDSQKVLYLASKQGEIFLKEHVIQ